MSRDQRRKMATLPMSVCSGTVLGVLGQLACRLLACAAPADGESCAGLLVQLRADLGTRLAERDAQAQQSARHQRAECEVLERLESAANSSAHALEDARREASALAQQHQRLTQASAAAAEASAASLAAARTEIEQLRASLALEGVLAKQECEQWKELYVDAEWNARQAAAAAQEETRRQQQIELELVHCKQQSDERQKTLNLMQAQLQQLRRALADMSGQAVSHQTLSPECDHSMEDLLTATG